VRNPLSTPRRGRRRSLVMLKLYAVPPTPRGAIPEARETGRAESRAGFDGSGA